MAPGLAYVAISRVKKLQDLVIDAFNSKYLLRLKDSKVIRLRKEEEKRLRRKYHELLLEQRAKKTENRNTQTTDFEIENDIEMTDVSQIEANTNLESETDIDLDIHSDSCTCNVCLDFMDIDE